MRSKQKLISVIGGEYIELVVLDFLNKSFQDYQKSKFPIKDFFQIGRLQNTFANSGIILTIASIEGYMNRVFHFQKKTILDNKFEKKKPLDKFLSLVEINNNNFKLLKLEEILKEIFILRDCLIHNHIYSINLEFDEFWKNVEYNHEITEGYGDVKFNKYVNKKTYKTILLNLNVQPLKIGFEELFISLMVFDYFINLNQIIFKDSPFHLNYKLNDNWENNLSEILSYYYSKIPNKEFKEFVNIFSKQYFKIEYDLFVNQQKSVINNYCPFCGAFGFHKIKDKHNCDECGEEIIIGEVTTILGS